MNDKIPYLDQPCERCGSKKALTKVHKETVHNLISTSVIEYSQIVCTNAACQKEFEINLAQKAEKAEALKLKKEELRSARIK